MTSSRNSRSVSVRELIGNPDLPLPPDRAWERIHAAVQAKLRRTHKSFRAELPLRANVALSQLDVVVSGRLDGLRAARAGAVLYEIKPVPSAPRAYLNSPELDAARHQLRFYADLARAGGVLSRPPAKLALLLVGPDGAIAEEAVDYDPAFGYLKRRLCALFEQPRQRVPFTITPSTIFQDDARSDRPLQALAFSALASTSSNFVLLALPPGAGKTRVALRVVLQHAACGGQPIQWITSKARGREEVLAELSRLRSRGLHVRAVWKTSVARRCSACDDPARCDRRRSTREAIFFGDLDLRAQPALDSPAELDLWCTERGYCPHAVSAALEPLADVVIADLNYLLESPAFGAPAALRVIDEAQNIGRRIRDHWNLRVSFTDLRAALRDLPAAHRSLFRPLLVRNTEEFSDHELWTRLADFLEVTARPSQDPVARFARAVTHFGTEYRIARGTERGEHFWIGLLRDPGLLPRNLTDRESGLTLALSGSLPASTRARELLIPDIARFHIVEPEPAAAAIVQRIPLLDFTHPLTLSDHALAAAALHDIRLHFGPSVLVFGQNSESNAFLSDCLRGLGHTSLLDSDLGSDWSLAESARPAFVLTVPGSNLAESVSPPDALFSCAVVLSAGYHPPSVADQFARFLLESSGTPGDSPVDTCPRWRVEAASRIVQAIGRLNRHPASRKPVFLLNRAFASPDWVSLWPRHWAASSTELPVWNSLEECLQSFVAAHE